MQKVYDQIIKAKQQAKIRHQQMDAKRRKFQDDLEAREEAHRLAQLHKQKLKVKYFVNTVFLFCIHLFVLFLF